MTHRCLKRGFADSRGQSIVEFSLLSVTLFLLTLGVFEMCRMMLVYTTVADAARAGCRYAIVHGADASPVATDALVQTQVLGYLSAAPVNLSNATVTTTGAGGAKGTTVSVSLTYTYDPWILFYTNFFSHSISSTSEGVITW